MQRLVVALAGLAVLAAAAPAPAPASAQSGAPTRRSDYTLELLDQLRQETVWRERQADPDKGHLLYFAELSLVAPGGHRDVAIAGQGDPGPITVVAFCDMDCLDMQITVVDAAGNHVAAAASTGRFAETTFHRDGVRSYFARITMPRCEAAYCFYALGTLSRQ